MKYLKIVDWDKFQHYKKRNPPWIKIHTSLLDNELFECLHNDSKVLLICLWLFTARKGNGEIPANLAYLQRKLPIGKKVNLQPLIDAGFIECYQDNSKVIATDDSKVLSSDRERDRDKTETKTEAKKDIVPFDKSDFWKLYPRKVAKGAAERAWQSLSPDSKLNDEILAAVRGQVESGILKFGDKFTPHPATWLNAKRWLDIPEKDEERRRAAKQRAATQAVKDAKAAQEHKAEEIRKLKFTERVKKMNQSQLFTLYGKVPSEHQENLKKLRPDITEWPK